MKNIMLDVKSFQETLGGGYCGPASLKIVLNYYGMKKSEKELAKLCNRDADLGTDDKSMKKAAESLGFRVEIKNESNFDDILGWLKKGVPVIVNWFTRGRYYYPEDEVADGHYSVIIGLDETSIYLQDPEVGRVRKIKREDFYRVWFDYTSNFIEKWEDLIIRQIIAIYK
ncbi:C39 family peptidase [Candidatus Woesebacteria bacterium]|nr:MAG: C39 family peptidase [Candidatus Woesebacteria bacterium]